MHRPRRRGRVAVATTTAGLAAAVFCAAWASSSWWGGGTLAAAQDDGAAAESGNSAQLQWHAAAAGGRDEDDFFVLVYLSTYGSAFGSWLLALVLAAAYCRCTAGSRMGGVDALGGHDFESFEQSLIVTLRTFGRASVLGLLACHGWLAYLYFDAEEEITAPFFGIARPLLCILVASFGWFSDSHPLFRWVVRVSGFLLLHRSACNSSASVSAPQGSLTHHCFFFFPLPSPLFFFCFFFG